VSALLTPEAMGTLLMLIFLQAVLGFDNLLYISIESKRCPEAQQSMVRKVGIGIAILLRLVLLVVLVSLIERFQDPFTTLSLGKVLHAEISVHALIVLVGGVFIIYTAIKELMHMLAVHDVDGKNKGPMRSAAKAIAWIVAMNLVFSFDSILAAISLTSGLDAPEGPLKEGTEIAIMAIAIIISGIMMIALANTVAEFLQKNRLYEVLGLFILLIVGVMLITEGGHLAHLELMGNSVEAMSKTTFYFVIVVLVLVDVVQGRYQKKLMLEQEAEQACKI
jgi:predicted tellurium resistance membrane protein TerC